MPKKNTSPHIYISRADNGTPEGFPLHGVVIDAVPQKDNPYLLDIIEEPLPDHDEFYAKALVFEQWYEEVTPFDFYRFIFPEGSLERLGHQEDKKPNGLILELTENADGKTVGHHTILTDGLEQLSEALKSPCVICSPISYYGRSRKASNALYMHALTLDIDYVGVKELKNLLAWCEKGIIPKPTFVVNSGHGVHLYYVFETPVPMFKENQQELRKLKRQLVKQIWTKHTSTNVDAQEVLGVVQGFRMVGSNSKLEGYSVAAYRVGERVTVDYLNGWVMPEHQANIYEKHGLSLHEAKEKYPDWYQRIVVEGQKPGRWHIKRDLYDWYKGRIVNEATFGHRYFCMMCLAVYAQKCDISYEELENDALSFQKSFNSINSDHPFTVEETYKALEAYNESYVTFPREAISRLTAMPMPANKRNGRKQAVHMATMRAVQNVLDPEGNWRNKKGRPAGSGTKKEQILKYAAEHPDANHSEIARELGISRPTVIKWLRAQNCADYDAE